MVHKMDRYQGVLGRELHAKKIELVGKCLRYQLDSYSKSAAFFSEDNMVDILLAFKQCPL
jgi:hypothetical protein